MKDRRKPRAALWTFAILLSLAQISPVLAGVEENQSLIYGVIGGFPDWIHEALRQGADINGQGSAGEVALHVAVRVHNPDMLKLLLELGADVQAKDYADNSALHWAVYHERIEMAKILIDRNADVNAKNAMGMTPLHFAASCPTASRYPSESPKEGRYVSTDFTQLLLSNGANVDAKAGSDMDEVTPLMVAVLSGHNECAQILLENGANPNAKNTKGFRLLDIAASSGDAQSVRLLLKYGANPDEAGPDGYAPLIRAIYTEKAKNVVALINGGASTEDLPYQYIIMLDRWLDDEGQTFVHIAVWDGGVAAIDFSISQFFLLDGFDNQGWTPLHVAAFCGHTDAADRLLAIGVSVDRHQSGVSTPLIIAAAAGEKEMVALLLKNGADPNIKIGAGYTALHAAAQGSYLPRSFLLLSGSESEAERDERELRYESVIRLLLAAGADKTVKNKDNRIPYEVALHHENSRAVEILKP